MNQSIYIIILIVLLSFAVYKIIKKLCYPIKTTTTKTDSSGNKYYS